MRALITTAKMKNGGSRLVHNKSITHMSDTNICTCLLDSILVILPPSKNKELVGPVIASSMHVEGDTSIIDISNALSAHGLMLERVAAKYIRKGRAPFHLLQENDCRLVINIKLTNLEGRTMCHFVAWDGKVIYD